MVSVVIAHVRVSRLDQGARGVFLDKGAHRARVGLGPEGGFPGQDEFRVLGVGHPDFGVVDVDRTRLSLRVERDDPLIEFVGLLGGRGPLVVLPGQLEDRPDILRILGVEAGQGLVGVDSREGLLERLEVGIGRRPVADDPVDLLPVPVEDEDGRRRLDPEAGENGFPGEVAAGGAVEDESLREEVGELGVLVNLLDQQVAASSAASLVEIDEDELVLLLGLGQGLVERALQERRRLAGGHGRDEENSGECCQLFHAGLHTRMVVTRKYTLKRRALARPGGCA
jgi:hypothetical protein